MRRSRVSKASLNSLIICSSFLGGCSAAARAASSRQFVSCILPSLARCWFGTLSFYQRSDLVEQISRFSLNPTEPHRHCSTARPPFCRNHGLTANNAVRRVAPALNGSCTVRCAPVGLHVRLVSHAGVDFLPPELQAASHSLGSPALRTMRTSAIGTYHYEFNDSLLLLF